MKTIISLIFLLISTIQLSAQWSVQYSNSQVYFYSVFMGDENDGFAVGTNSDYTSGRIYRTTNGGEDWSNVPGIGNRLFSVWFSAPNIGFAVGSFGTIIKTTDGGSSWSNRPSGTTKLLESVFFINANTGWAVGGHMADGVVILKTTDQGETWNDNSFPVVGLLKDIYFTDSNNGWTVGSRQEDLGGGNYIDNEIILKTTDGGETWVEKPSGTYDCQLRTVYFKDANTGWAGGAREYNYPNDPWVVIFKTTNGGDSWQSQINGKHGVTTSLRFCDDNVGWAAGRGDQWGNQYGLNYKTTDGGNTWIHQTNLNDISMNYIFFLNPTTGWGTSVYKIFKYQTATDVSEISSIPRQYNLSQNYPNPFNPTTTINYQIPELSFVTLKVYDVLGNEIATIINEEKPMGNYEVEFSAKGGLPSGVYYYNLLAGSFVETKKMILMK